MLEISIEDTQESPIAVVTEEMYTDAAKDADIAVEDVVAYLTTITTEGAGTSKVTDVLMSLWNKFIALIKSIGRFLSVTFRKFAASLSGDIALDEKQLNVYLNEIITEPVYVPIVKIQDFEKVIMETLDTLHYATNALIELNNKIISDPTFAFVDAAQKIKNDVSTKLNVDPTKLSGCVNQRIFGETDPKPQSIKYGRYIGVCGPMGNITKFKASSTSRKVFGVIPEINFDKFSSTTKVQKKKLSDFIGKIDQAKKDRTDPKKSYEEQEYAKTLVYNAESHIRFINAWIPSIMEATMRVTPTATALKQYTTLAVVVRTKMKLEK